MTASSWKRPQQPLNRGRIYRKYWKQIPGISQVTGKLNGEPLDRVLIVVEMLSRVLPIWLKPAKTGIGFWLAAVDTLIFHRLYKYLVMFVLEGKKKGEEKNYIVDHFFNMAPWDCCRVWRGLVWSLFTFHAAFLLIITPGMSTCV